MKKRIIISLSFFVFTLFQVMPLIAQTDSKVLTLTVSGSGKTQEEAKQNALRSAIEQAFGAFISSNTQILDDALIKDEIISVSSGNIQEYAVISEVQTPDGIWSNNVKAKVSIEKLTTFCESKGVTAVLKGSLFAANIKIQNLNKKNEEIAIENMCFVLKEIIEKAFDYEIKIGEPKSAQSENEFVIPITIHAIPNNNLNNVANYFCSTMIGLSLSEAEVENYISLKKDIYRFILEPTSTQNSTKLKSDDKKKPKESSNSNVLEVLPVTIALRSDVSMNNLSDLMHYFKKGLFNFKVFTNIDTKLGNDFFYIIHGWKSREGLRITDLGFKPYYFSGDYNDFGTFYNKGSVLKYKGEIITPYTGFLSDFKAEAFNLRNSKISFNNLPIGQKIIELTYSEIRTLEEVSKISEYKIQYCKNKLGETPDPVRGGGFFIYKAIVE